MESGEFTGTVTVSKDHTLSKPSTSHHGKLTVCGWRIPIENGAYLVHVIVSANPGYKLEDGEFKIIGPAGLPPIGEKKDEWITDQILSSSAEDENPESLDCAFCLPLGEPSVFHIHARNLSWTKS